tara:strand:+ start:363 stop:848 length:486 start_codon:yes stop_codon:yes gene_type:complete
MIQLIENALPKEINQKLNHLCLKDHDFPFFYVKGVASEDDTDFFFMHILYNKGKVNSVYFNEVSLPLLGLIKYSKLMRVKINCYPNQSKPIVNSFHVDSDDSHMVALYSINDNNGYTEFENGEKFISKANQLLIFDGKMKHRSISQTDTNLRLNININYVV